MVMDAGPARVPGIIPGEVGSVMFQGEVQYTLTMQKY